MISNNRLRISIVDDSGVHETHEPTITGAFPCSGKIHCRESIGERRGDRLRRATHAHRFWYVAVLVESIKALPEPAHRAAFAQ